MTARPLRAHELPLALVGLSLLFLVPFLQGLLSAPESGGLGGALLSFGAEAPKSSDDEAVVTRLDSADPLAMILRRGDASKDGEAAAAASAPEPARSSGPTEPWHDAVSAARAGTSRAMSRSAGFPRPGRRIEGALRGLVQELSSIAASRASVSTAPAPKLSAVTSQGLFGAPRTRDSMTQVLPARGLASGNAAAPGTSPAAPGPAAAANPAPAGSSTLLTPMTGKASGSVSPASGDATANPSSGGGAKDSKAVSGPPATENLALLRQKQEMEQSIKLKYDKKRYDQLERKKMFEQIATQTAFQTAQQVALKLLDAALGNNKQQNGQGNGQQNNAGNGAAVPLPRAAAVPAMDPGQVVPMTPPAGYPLSGPATRIVQGGKAFWSPIVNGQVDLRVQFFESANGEPARTFFYEGEPGSSAFRVEQAQTPGGQVYSHYFDARGQAVPAPPDAAARGHQPTPPGGWPPPASST